jgi:hypothetical protein
MAEQRKQAIYEGWLKREAAVQVFCLNFKFDDNNSKLFVRNRERN